MPVQYKAKTFEDYVMAKEFAKANNGVVEGPMLDEKINIIYIVIYKEGEC